MDSWDAQQISQKEKRGQESTKKQSRSDGNDLDVSTTRYRISLGEERGKSNSQIEKELTGGMDTPPDHIKIKKDDEYGLVFVDIFYEEEEMAKKAYREQDGRIKYNEGLRKMTEPG
jgi:hypothetical protein